MCTGCPQVPPERLEEFFMAHAPQVVYDGPSNRVTTADGRFTFERGVPVDLPEPVRSRLLEQASFTEVRGTGKTREAEPTAAED